MCVFFFVVVVVGVCVCEVEDGIRGVCLERWFFFFQTRDGIRGAQGFRWLGKLFKGREIWRCQVRKYQISEVNH